MGGEVVRERLICWGDSDPRDSRHEGCVGDAAVSIEHIPKSRCNEKQTGR